MLNAIIRNEAARIERMLKSVAPYIKSYSILDTGSTDDTPNMIRNFFDDLGIKGHIHYGTFQNFSQARNEAFAHARGDNGKHETEWCQFALLVDADMELSVQDTGELLSLNANALSYDMMQKAGTTSYANRRLLNLNWGTDPYLGVTHEYLDVPAAGMIKGSYFIDHADGANRVNKAARDITLLEQGLKDEPGNGRYLYYLANSYRDAGQFDKAIEAYQKRIAMGGWDEETHSAMMNMAFCEKDSLNFPGFIETMIQAHNARPQRAEPLYELAKAYRERNQQRAGLLFAKAGLNVKRPNDMLFVNDYVYEHGLRYEYSILGFYDDAERARAFEVTDDLTLDPTCPADQRSSAKRNLFWHLKPLNIYCPSFAPVKLDFTPPEGYTAINPSVEVYDGNITCNGRCVNYKIDEQGRYMIGPKSCQDAPIDTRNFLVQLNEDLSIKGDAEEIIWERPAPAWPMVTGLEDIRLYRVKGHLCFSACIREQEVTGMPQQIRGVIEDGKVVSWAKMSEATACEKNWMPIANDKQDFVYRLDRIAHTMNLDGSETKNPVDVYVGEISGGSQAIPFKCGYLAVVHEASVDPTNNKRTYWHRFARFNSEMELVCLSLPFVFFDRQIEFCCGVAYCPNRNNLILSFGVRDAEAWVAKVSIEEVSQMFRVRR
jgi:glycosyltransferase involved in cell wall biosynthesis